MVNRGSRCDVGTILGGVVLVISAALAIFPITWVGLTALKNRVDAFAMPPKWLFTPTLDNFRAILERYSYSQYFWNSVLVVTGTVLIAMAIGTLAAYGFARFRIRRGDDILFWILTIRMFPPIAGVIPIYLIAARFNLLDTKTVLIISYLSFTLPIVVWMMRSFVADIPKELDEAAMVDGLTRFGALRKVVLPLCLPAIMATATFATIQCWNEFLYAVVLTGPAAKTMPVAVSAFYTDRGIMWEMMAAAGVLAIAPVIVFTFLIHRYLVRGLTLGAVKG